MFAFIFFTEGFGYWKTVISCKRWRSKLIQSSLETYISKKRQYNTDPTEDNKNDSGNSQNQSVDDDSNSLQQNTNVIRQSNGYSTTGHGRQAQELQKKQANSKPLKVVVRRYTTKVQKRHHMEEAEANLESSDSDVEGSAATE